MFLRYAPKQNGFTCYNPDLTVFTFLRMLCFLASVLLSHCTHLLLLYMYPFYMSFPLSPNRFMQGIVYTHREKIIATSMPPIPILQLLIQLLVMLLLYFITFLDHRDLLIIMDYGYSPTYLLLFISFLLHVLISLLSVEAVACFANHTRHEVRYPPDIAPMGYKWGYIVKLKSDGSRVLTDTRLR